MQRSRGIIRADGSLVASLSVGRSSVSFLGEVVVTSKRFFKTEPQWLKCPQCKKAVRFWAVRKRAVCFTVSKDGVVQEYEDDGFPHRDGPDDDGFYDIRCTNELCKWTYDEDPAREIPVWEFVGSIGESYVIDDFLRLLREGRNSDEAGNYEWFRYALMHCEAIVPRDVCERLGLPENTAVLQAIIHIDGLRDM